MNLRQRWMVSAFLVQLGLLPLLVKGSPWIWDPAESGGTVPGGVAGWNSLDPFWWDGSANVVWPGENEPAASVPAGEAIVTGSIAADALTIGAAAEVRLDQGNFTNGNRLTVRGDVTGEGAIRFHSDAISGSLRYANTLLTGGLHFVGGSATGLEVDLLGVNLNSSQVLVVDGEGTDVTFNGFWRGDGGNAFPHLFLRNGGRFIFADNAHLNFINDAYFTRQLWVKGEGISDQDGRVEFAEGFVADLTEGGTVTDGFGSIRINHGVVLTRHTQSIPVGQRPRPGNPDGPQTNGHFVFENNPGRWIVETNDQEYAGGVWIRADLTLDIATRLRHTGVTEDDTESDHPYRAGNAWQTNQNNLTMIKRGLGDLVLAGEQAYQPGTVMRVEEGSVVMESNPGGGFFHNGINSALSPAGPDLELEVLAGGMAAFHAPFSGLKRIANQGGTLLVDGEVNLEEDFGQNDAGSGDPAGWLMIVLDESGSALLQVGGTAHLGGVLHLEAATGFSPTTGMVFDVLQAGSLVGEFAEISTQPGLNLDVEQLADRIRVTVAAANGGGMSGVIIEENFDDIAAWYDLSTAVSWTSDPAATTVFTTAEDTVGGASSVLTLNEAAYTVGMWGDQGIRSFSALDYIFPEPVIHRDQILTIEFRLRWSDLSSAEGNRVGLTLVHDYVDGTLDLTPDVRFNDFSQPWWGRPAYQLRLRPGNPNISGNSGPLMLYGGGNDPDGEFESDNDSWFPGFSSAPGGTAPGVGNPYPENGWVRGNSTPAPVSTDYLRYRYIVRPNVQELWVNWEDDGEDWELFFDMPLPFEEDAPTDPAPPLYRYFEQFEGLRLYFRTAGSNTTTGVFFDSVSIRVEDADPAGGFAAWVAENLGSVELNGPADDPFGQGISNLERYALGYPVTGLPSPGQRPRVVNLTGPEGGTFFQFRRPLEWPDDVGYAVQISTDLSPGSWTAVEVGEWIVTEEAGEEIIAVQLVHGSSEPEPSRLFARLVLTLN